MHSSFRILALIANLLAIDSLSPRTTCAALRAYAG
jgi:hypothetical protein